MQDRSIAGAGIFFEDIAKSGHQDIEGVSGCKTWHNLLMEKMEAAQVIDTVDMVGMGMGEEDRVDSADSLTECLTAQIGGGVHQDVPVVVSNEQRCPRATVPDVIRGADPAVASDHRHTGGCPAPQDYGFHAASLV